MTGPLATPPVFDGFDFRAFLARSGVHSVLPAHQVTFLEQRQAAPLPQALFDFRARALVTLRRLFPQPQAELLAGILLGLDSGHRRPKFVKDFLAEGGSVAGAVQAYCAAVRDGSFPDAEHAYQ